MHESENTEHVIDLETNCIYLCTVAFPTPAHCSQHYNGHQSWSEKDSDQNKSLSLSPQATKRANNDPPVHHHPTCDFSSRVAMEKICSTWSWSQCITRTAEGPSVLNFLKPSPLHIVPGVATLDSSSSFWLSNNEAVCPCEEFLKWVISIIWEDNHIWSPM
jgi:hypothetical protein